VQVRRLDIDGPLLILPTVFGDERGFFLESWQQQRYAEAGIDCEFVQDNHSLSRRGTVRGLHYQRGPGQDKLVRVARGRILDVVVDIRPGSTTFGRWIAEELDSTDHRQLFVPAGFAHGFQVLSEEAEVLYKVSTPYDAALEAGIQWDDPDLGIPWPLSDVTVSDRDRSAPSLASLPRESR
jgi:dTDP-4-dehydrorhamnose 3,5-epimerase